MRKIISSFAFALLFCLNLWPQANDIMKEAFEDAEYFFAREEYEEAAFYYRQLTEQYPDHANFNFKLGECYLNIPGSEVLAIPYLEEAVNNTVDRKEYKGKDFTETKAPLHAYFYLGNAYRINNQLLKALEVYDIFINSPYFYGNYNVAIVNNEIDACQRAKIIQDNPISMQMAAIDSSVNTSASELYPVVSSDEQALVFVRRLRFYDAIYFSTKQAGLWSEPVNLNPVIGSDGDFYPASISSDKKELYLIKRDEVNSDVYVCFWKDSVWSKAEKLNKRVNSKANETSAWISEDGKILYFSSTRRGGAGGKDIYFSVRNENGDWGRARNLGKTINSRFDEEYPCLTNSDNTLYFSSQGHYSMGGFDIFFSNKAGKDWEEVVNAGFPLNNTGDNTGYISLNGGKAGYISRMNMTNASNEDIYRVVIQSNLPISQEAIE